MDKYSYAIVGSRDFSDYGEVCKVMDVLGKKYPIGRIVSGGARGADTLAEAYAKECGLPMVIYRPDYERWKKSAPFVRNREIVNAADIVVAFWDGVSRGTKYTIGYAKKQKKMVCIASELPIEE